jgi:hydroxymethylpyrimidine pyrophosphatase-like HAD family hydrolase
MGKPYGEITRELAARIKLIMTDVDGTLLTSVDYVGPEVIDAVSQLKNTGITVGLVSGRAIPRLERLTAFVGTDGPIIAENGGSAKMSAGGELLELGYSRQPALEALGKLKEAYPGNIKEKESNADRLIDVAFEAPGIPVADLRKHVNDIQLLDSGYMLHLLQEGISKGDTLKKVLERMGEERPSPEEIMVFGDSLTDISLFELFPHSVLVINPGLLEEQVEPMRQRAEYMSSLNCEEGFIEVASHIVKLRESE